MKSFIKNYEIQQCFNHLSDGIRNIFDAIGQDFNFLEEDRPIENELRKITQNILLEKWKLYE